MQSRGTRDMRTLAVQVRAQQQTGKPVHLWPVLAPLDADWAQSYQTVGQFMSTDLFTVRPDDLVDLAASVMDWRHIRHVPVEDEAGRLVGLVSHRDLLRLLAYGLHDKRDPVAVSEILKPNPVTAAPDTP